MDDKHVCPICGEPTYKYFGNYRKDGLCTKHGLQANAGEIVLCEKCGKWHEPDKECEKNEDTKDPGTCIVCGKPKKKADHVLCHDCWREAQAFCETISKGKTIHDYRDYYFNVKDRISIMKDLATVQKNCNKLIAIAITAQDVGDEVLLPRVFRDIESLIESKKKIKVQKGKIEEERKENDEQKEKTKTAEDGHILRSDAEVTIDDFLYNAFILHCYEKPVIEVLPENIKCDWYIPIKNDEGIYIEYWGMDTPEYNERRKRKEELYKKNNIPYISIEKDAWKQDSQTFKARLIREITQLAKERYGSMPKWR